MPARLIALLTVLVLVEYYSYSLVAHMSAALPRERKIITVGLYLFISVACWVTVFFFRQFREGGGSQPVRNVVAAILFSVLAGKLVVFLFMLTDDIRRLGVWLWRFAGAGFASKGHGYSVSRSEFLRNAAFALGSLTVGSLIFGIRNRYNYKVRQVVVKMDGIAEGLKGLKIVQLSDIHTGSFDNPAAVGRGIDLVLRQNPDVIFFTGDLVNNLASEVDEKYLQLFKKLRAPMGVYSILGNHDYSDYVDWPSQTAKEQNRAAVRHLHEQAGWRLLLNEHVVLERGGGKMGVIGVENWSARGNFSKYGDLAKACNGIAQHGTSANILLSHDPSHWDAEVSGNYPAIGLTLSGHTHGMQFGIESALLNWSPVQYFYKHWGGLYRSGTQHLYVNRGFGFIGYPGRVGILPEITVIELA